MHPVYDFPPHCPHFATVHPPPGVVVVVGLTLVTIVVAVGEVPEPPVAAA